MGDQGGRVFHLFPNLPTELRLKIWSLVHEQPRIVPIVCGAGSISVPTDLGPSSTGCVSPAAIPGTLHTCRESRSEALRKYSLMFGMYRQTGRIFFDPELDFLYFGKRDGYMASESQLRTVLQMCPPQDLARVRRVAVNDAVFRDGSENQVRAAAASRAAETLASLRRGLPALEEVFFVPRDENPVHGKDVVFLSPHQWSTVGGGGHHLLLGSQICGAIDTGSCDDDDGDEVLEDKDNVGSPERHQQCHDTPPWPVMGLKRPASPHNGELGQPDYDLVDRAFLSRQQQHLVQQDHRQAQQQPQLKDPQYLAAAYFIREGYHSSCSNESASLYLPRYTTNPGSFYGF